MSSKPEQQLKVGDWWYLPEQDKLVKVDASGEVITTADLDNLCQKAMNYFIVNAGRLITRDEILADVWGVRDVSDGRICWSGCRGRSAGSRRFPRAAFG